ncbi:MFS transporter [Phytomonospora endophytica]|uniref:MFS family permease n=1 Tax=Phytomonospora endophytica TaxID=714109 RepID=A0A841FJH5_9ACTN|nr:MFS transporter [Phytomonospora endophytica]MBB6033988.1 MFS family permease [Phytomonospora endophytica]GIG64491.1 MFS transporter [Phytomonospora endophytica]
MSAAKIRLGRDFNLLWAGQTVSYVGDKVNMFVVPTVMILFLDASAFQVGLVGMAQWVAIPLLSLVAGVLVDRWNLRSTLIWCDVIRFAVILMLPVAYWLDVLSVPLVWGSVAVVSAASVFFNIGYTATISAITTGEGRVKAYSNMETSRTTSEVVGPAIASGLYQLMGVASLLVDAVTYLLSAAGIRAMRPYGGGAGRSQSMRTRLKRGFLLNWNDRVLRGTMLATLLSNIGGPIFVVVMPILAYRGLNLSVGVFGTVMSVAALGAVGGALLAQRVSRWFGAARVMPWAIFLHSFVGLGVLLAPALPAAIVLGATLTCYGMTMVWYNISTAAIRQARVPAEDQAVSHAAFRTVTWGIIPLAALFGGIVVEQLDGPLGILDAAKYTMVGATLIGTFLAWIPIAGSQRRLDREKAAAEALAADGEEKVSAT